MKKSELTIVAYAVFLINVLRNADVDIETAKKVIDSYIELLEINGQSVPFEITYSK